MGWDGDDDVVVNGFDCGGGGGLWTCLLNRLTPLPGDEKRERYYVCRLRYYTNKNWNPSYVS